MTSHPSTELSPGEKLRHLVEKAIDGRLAPGKNDHEASELRALAQSFAQESMDQTELSTLLATIMGGHAPSWRVREEMAGRLLQAASVVKHIKPPVWKQPPCD